jgi:hypothetical protein
MLMKHLFPPKPEAFLEDPSGVRDVRMHLLDKGINIQFMSSGESVDLFQKSGLSFDEQYVLTGGDNRPLANAPYTARFTDGSVYQGHTDDTGRTRRFYTIGAKYVRIYVGHRQF